MNAILGTMAKSDRMTNRDEVTAIDWQALEQALRTAKEGRNFNQAIVNIPFTDKFLMAQFGLGIMVLLRVNEEKKTINRIALSETYPAKGAVMMSSKKFEEIVIPLDDPENIIAQAITSGKYVKTTDWHYLFTPDLTAEEARFNQAGAGIATSVVYPLAKKGALIFSYFTSPSKIGPDQHSFMKTYSEFVARHL